jgi:hypothetical protein
MKSTGILTETRATHRKILHTSRSDILTQLSFTGIMVGMILGIVALHDSEQEAPMRQKIRRIA